MARNKKNLEFLEKAQQEAQESRAYYDSVQDGLGQEFKNEVDKTLKRIFDNPYQFPKGRREKRIAQVNRFPFVVIFQVRKLIILVISIFHTSRNPKEWENRE